ncbi:MAG: alkaline phosphatase family protein [Nitrospinota bacterium]
MTLSRKVIVSFAVAAVLLLPFAQFSTFSQMYDAPKIPKVVVLGFDGIDPVLLEEYMQKGELPNFDSLRKTGGFSELATTNPPQSPVAWASFMTGANPGKHNVFDFLTRDPKTYMPKLTITEIEPPEGFEVMGYNISLKGPLVIGYRKGKTFWQIASEAGVPSTVLLIPVTFPPDRNAKMLSGMGVPDVTGTNGTFSFYTTDPLALTGAEGGRIVHVIKKGNSISAELVGPKNDLLKERPQTKITFTAEITGEGKATVRLQGREFEISQGRFSEWKHIEFKLAPFVSVKAIARFLLVSTKPEIGIYVSPLNFDPAEPALPISNPPGYSAEVEKEIGPYATQGMPEDTWALTENVIDDATFLEQVKLVQKERERIFFLELGKLKGGILAAVFVSSDRVQHMFWRYRDSGHPLNDQIHDPLRDPLQDEKNRDPVLEVYRHMDTILGRTMKYIDGDTTLIVVSDHGFKSFRRAVHLNRWLIENGYMALKKSGQGGVFFSDVDWSRTKAFALGMNGLYLNLAGR